MGQSQVLVRLHLLQARQGTLEFELESSTGIQLLRRHFGRHQQLDTTIIKLIDHIDEPTNLVILRRPHARHIGHQYGMKLTRQLNVVILATWTIAQLTEFEPHDIIVQSPRFKQAMIDLQGDITLTRMPGNFTKAACQFLLGSSIQRRMKNLGTLQGTQTIIDPRIHIDHFTVTLDQLNGWQKASPLQTVLVEIIRYNVRSRHQYHAAIE